MIVPILVVAGLAWLGRVVGGGWLAPVAFVPALWTAYLVVSAALAGLLPVCLPGLWVMVTMLVAFTVGALLLDGSGARPVAGGAPPVPPESWRRLERRVTLALIAFTLIHLAGVVSLARGGLARGGLDWTTAALLRLGNVFSVARYGGTEDIPAIVRMLIYAAFPAAFLGGATAALTDRPSRRWLAVTPLVVSLLGGMVVAARAGLLIATCMWVGVFLAARVARGETRFGLFRPTGALAAAGALAFLLGAYALVQWLRGGTDAPFEVTFLAQHAFANAFGSVAAFSQWGCFGDPGAPTLGALTFAGPFEVLGLAQRVQGSYDVTVYFPSGHSTNIYTVFRGLAEDFGMAGAWLVLVGGGWLGALAYRRVLRGRASWCIPLSVIYASAIFSLWYSMFTFNSVVLGWVVGAAVWVWPERPTSIIPSVGVHVDGVS